MKKIEILIAISVLFVVSCSKEKVQNEKEKVQNEELIESSKNYYGGISVILASAKNKPSCHQKGCPLEGEGCIIILDKPPTPKARFSEVVGYGSQDSIASYFSIGGGYYDLFGSLELTDPEIYTNWSSGDYYIAKEVLANGKTVYYSGIDSDLSNCDNVEYMVVID